MPLTTFNRTNKSIDWAAYSWNPVTGCLGPDGKGPCKYCYAKEIADRFPKNYPNGFKPEFRENRLIAPRNTKVPQDPKNRFCFVCSMMTSSKLGTSGVDRSNLGESERVP